MSEKNCSNCKRCKELTGVKCPIHKKCGGFELWESPDTQLKECPFCGEKSAMVTQYGSKRWSTNYECTECGAGLETGEEENFGTAWNKRPIESKLQTRIAELEAENKRLKSFKTLSDCQQEILNEYRYENEGRLDLATDKVKLKTENGKIRQALEFVGKEISTICNTDIEMGESLEKLFALDLVLQKALEEGGEKE